jgi:hypothetical protein
MGWEVGLREGEEKGEELGEVPFESSDSCITLMDQLIDTKTKCRHLKKLTCKGTLWQVFIGVYRLEIQSVMLVFSTQLYDLLLLQPYLYFNSPPLPHFPV